MPRIETTVTRRFLAGGLSALAAGGGAGAGEAGQCRARAAYAGRALHAAPPPGLFAAAAKPFVGSLPPARVKALDTAFATLVDRLKTDTLTAAVARPGGGLWTETRVPPSSGARRFFWASIGKAFTATVILQLIAEGRLSLGDRLERWDGRFPNARLITVDDLLSHTSGLYSFQEDPGLRARPGWKTPTAVLDVARARPALFCPGGGWSYSNTGYVLLGRIIEAIDRRPYAAAVTARIIDPLGLIDTTIISPEGAPDDVPRPRSPSGDGTTDDLRTPFAAGAVVATAPDMIRFWQALFGGRLLAAEVVRAQFERLHPLFDQAGLFYGRGVMLYDLPVAPDQADVWLGHSGGMPGLKAIAAYSSRHDAWVAVSSLGDGAAEAAANLLLRQLSS